MLNKLKNIYWFSKKLLVKNAKLSLHPRGEFISDQIRKHGHHYEIQLLKLCLDKFDCSHFVDIGANIGNHTNFFEVFGSKCIAFEPSKKNFDLLRKNAPCSDVFNCALGDEASVLEFVTYENSMGNCHLPSNFGNKSEIKPWGDRAAIERVNVKTLDSFNLDHATLIKIDVEGSELKVLKGALNTFKKFKPALWIEIHNDNILEKSNFPYRRADIFKFLGALGYSNCYSAPDDSNLFFHHSLSAMPGIGNEELSSFT